MLKSSEIKKVALNKIKNKNTIAVSVIFVIVNIALSYLLTLGNNWTVNTPILQLAVNLIYMALVLPMSFGLISCISKIMKEERIQYTSIFNDAVLNFSKVISIFIRTILKMLLPSILIIIAITGILFLTAQNIPLTQENVSAYSLYIVLLYFFVLVGIAISALPYVLSSYALAANKDLTPKECIIQSKELMDGKKFEYIKLLLSFFGWLFLLAASATIIHMLTIETLANAIIWVGMIFLTPYVIASTCIFYEECASVTEK